MRFQHLVLAAAILLSATTVAQVANEAALRAQAEKLIAAMEIRDIDAILTMVSKNGITVGTGAQPMKFKEFEKTLRKKSQVYCALMDDGCIENRRDSALIDSLHNKPALTITPWSLIPGGASVTSKYGRHESELDFVQEDGQWKLKNVEWN